MLNSTHMEAKKKNIDNYIDSTIMNMNIPSLPMRNTFRSYSDYDDDETPLLKNVRRLNRSDINEELAAIQSDLDERLAQLGVGEAFTGSEALQSALNQATTSSSEDDLRMRFVEVLQLARPILRGGASFKSKTTTRKVTEDS